MSVIFDPLIIFAIIFGSISATIVCVIGLLFVVITCPFYWGLRRLYYAFKKSTVMGMCYCLAFFFLCGFGYSLMNLPKH